MFVVLYFGVFKEEGQRKFHCIIHRLVHGPSPLQEKFLALGYVADFQQASLWTDKALLSKITTGNGAAGDNTQPRLS